MARDQLRSLEQNGEEARRLSLDGTMIFEASVDQPDEILNPVLLDVSEADRKAVVVPAANAAILDRASGPVWAQLDLDTGIPTAFEEVLSLPVEYADALREDLGLYAAPAFLTDSEGAVTGYLYLTMNADRSIGRIWRHDVSSSETSRLGHANIDEAELRPSRTWPRIDVGANGTAAILFGGAAWLASIDG